MNARTERPAADYGIRCARRAESGAVASLLARAFADDAVMAWMFPDPGSRARRTTRFFELVQRQQRPRAGGVRVAATGDGRLLAAALWSGPGRGRPGAARELATVPRYAHVFGVRGLSRAAAVQNALQEAHPDTPHWYLPTLGTDPAFQGTGVGSALVREQLAQCDRLGQPAYLESSMASNLPFYEGLGFRVTGEIRLPGGGPDLWPMWRDAGGGRR